MSSVLNHEGNIFLFSLDREEGFPIQTEQRYIMGVYRILQKGVPRVSSSRKFFPEDSAYGLAGGTGGNLTGKYL